MIKFVLDTDLKEIPANCGECPMYNCWLPETRDRNAVKKVYTKKRHPSCPLKVVDEGMSK